MTNEQHPKATLWTSCQERWPNDVAEVIRQTRSLHDAVHVAVMPDVQLANGFCVGTVLATNRTIYPSAVGSDIGCGMLALPWHARADVITERLARQLLSILPRLVPASRQHTPLINLKSFRIRLSSPQLDRLLLQDAVFQLGTLGTGNHFLELQRDEAEDRLWLMVHSGSRGLGQAISQWHLSQVKHRSLGRPYLDAQSPGGRAYLRDVSIARSFARLNRICMAMAVSFALHELAGLIADWSDVIHTDHNHVRPEMFASQKVWVHRKGAAPAVDGQMSVIPGSMGTASYHVLGRGHRESLRSSSHGAGRCMDRTSAKRRITTQALRKAMHGVWFDQGAIRHLTDEAPQAYKDIDQIISLQREQVRVIRRLLPILNYKGAKTKAK